ncbi:unnamed protein product [Albugo candida]|uniref:Uncharacterized protein n=1 Tax=Albugo candida TaxID=65357 RepID=A0A024GQI7_9STRA|nr:unnamed protein product [Albugo candida]|eukprot:CCI49165.1 unnamed protein product [Albugo candida]
MGSSEANGSFIIELQIRVNSHARYRCDSITAYRIRFRHKKCGKIALKTLHFCNINDSIPPLRAWECSTTSTKRNIHINDHLNFQGLSFFSIRPKNQRSISYNARALSSDTPSVFKPFTDRSMLLRHPPKSSDEPTKQYNCFILSDSVVCTFPCKGDLYQHRIKYTLRTQTFTEHPKAPNYR